MSLPPTDIILRHSDQEVRQILRQRKKRNRASCHPCRARKVKCDRSSPCDNCAKRGYPELCSFSNGAESHIELGTELPSPRPELPDQLERSQVRQRSPSLLARVRTSSFQDSHAPSEERGGTSSHVAPPRASSTRSSTAGGYDGTDVHMSGEDGEEQGQGQREPFLGTNSMPAFLRNEAFLAGSTQSTPNQAIEDAILPILGLQGSKSTYPFLPAQSTSFEKMKLELHEALPADREIIKLFQCYRTEAHSFSPIISNIDEFELELCAYIEDRSLRKRRSHIQNHDIHGDERWKSVSWVGSLFSVLASGAQFSDSSFEERRVKSQLYIRNSFQCLRMVNFLVRPSLLCIQTLLILGNVLQNDTKPEAAWMLLGTTVRMAQSLGLHKEPDNLSSPRRSLWLALVWQDSLLSLCFDRPPVTTPAINNTESVHESFYTNIMHNLCDRTLKSISIGAHRNSNDFTLILEAVADIEDLYFKCQTNNARLSNIRQRSQICALNLHISFVIAWLCRPALRNRQSSDSRTDVQLQLIEKCNKHLLECVRAFVRLHSLSILASRSWAVVHNGLSSALLLGLLDTAVTNPEVRQLQGEILDIISVDTQSESGHGKSKGDNTELSKPHARAVAALRKLYDDQDNDQARHAMTDTGRSYQGAPEAQLPPSWQGLAAPQDEAISNTWASGFSPTANLQPIEAIGQDLSPLEMFDSILWNDPIGSEEFIPDFNPSSSELWMF